MKRLALAASLLVTLLSAHPTGAQEPVDETGEVVDSGEPVVQDWPIGGVLGQRIFCVEGMESAHGRFMWNSTAVWNGEHAAGWLGFLPSTARHWGVVIGDRSSEWDGASRMIRSGAGAQFAGIAWGRC